MEDLINRINSLVSKETYEDTEVKELVQDIKNLLNTPKINSLSFYKEYESFYDDPALILEVEIHDFLITRSVLKDEIFKSKKSKTKEDLEIFKILQAREKNRDFELELAEMICGDNENFPYKSSYYITKFFNDLGFNFTHNGETRRIWIKERLEELSSKEIHYIISRGLFDKKSFYKFAKEKELNPEELYRKAINDFRQLIETSLSSDSVFDISIALDMNVNIELLFDNKANTSDIQLNQLIEEAKQRFLNPNDKQIALEKLWDAFERLKTFYDKNKKVSSSKVVELVSEGFDSYFIENEFKTLTNVGNSYRIRHHEKGKKELLPQHVNYFFFRMLSLIDLCLSILEKEKLSSEEGLF